MEVGAFCPTDTQTTLLSRNSDTQLPSYTPEMAPKCLTCATEAVKRDGGRENGLFCLVKSANENRGRVSDNEHNEERKELRLRDRGEKDTEEEK